MPTFDLGALRKARPRDYLFRFAFGGLVTALTGWVAHQWGPSVGGMFLAFPAVLPASLTLVKEHDGRTQAVDDARGGQAGTIGLIAFALVLFCRSAAWPPLAVLLLAPTVWLLVDVALWWLTFGRSPNG